MGEANFSMGSLTNGPEVPTQFGDVDNTTLSETNIIRCNDYGPKFRILNRSDQVIFLKVCLKNNKRNEVCISQIAELQTLIRDVETTRSDFKFVADRLIR